MPKSKSTKKTDINVTRWTVKILIWFGVFLVAMVVALSYFNAVDKIETNRITSGINDRILREEVRQLRFCVTNSISNCDSDYIQNTWNKENPDNKFTPKTQKEIIDEAIKG